VQRVGHALMATGLLQGLPAARNDREMLDGHWTSSLVGLSFAPTKSAPQHAQPGSSRMSSTRCPPFRPSPCLRQARKTSRRSPTTKPEVRAPEPALFDYIEGFYNPDRIQQRLHYLSPIHFESPTAIYSALQRPHTQESTDSDKRRPRFERRIACQEVVVPHGRCYRCCAIEGGH
jgi:hypothetical protein